jgi:hypothetical protein
MADEEDAKTLSLELLDELADLGCLGRPQGRCRLVHDEHLGVKMDRARNRDGLALELVERADMSGIR